MQKIECFKIQLLEIEKNNIFDVQKGKSLKQINCDRFTLLREPKTIIADPFLFVHNDTLFLFYEDKKMYKPGVISMVSTKDLETWTEPCVVLREQCHLSYPWVFENDGCIYMVPETSAYNSVRLYEAKTDQLTEFEYKCTLLKEDHRQGLAFGYSDSSIYVKENVFYLMTTVNKNGINQLELYYSNTIFGKYEKHLKSPVIVGNKYGRNAGCLHKIDNKLYRVAQDCDGRYGDDVHLLEVDEMTQSEYKEHLVKQNLLAGKNGYYQEGGHQFNWVNFNGKIIVATDAKEYHRFFWNRALHKLKIY